MTAAQEWILVERRQQIMATGMSVHVAVPPAEKERAERAIADCLAWLEEIGRSPIVQGRPEVDRRHQDAGPDAPRR